LMASSSSTSAGEICMGALLSKPNFLGIAIAEAVAFGLSTIRKRCFLERFTECFACGGVVSDIDGVEKL
jgi:hypothetical protein